MKVPTERVLQRVRMTKQQALMKTRDAREENIKNAFVVADIWNNKLKDKNVLLVDDVFTTGSTLFSCASVLKSYGAATVGAITLARV